MARDQMDPAQALAELAQIRLRDTDLGGVLNRVAELSRASLPGATEVSVTLVRRRHAHTAAFTGQLAVDLDEMQYEEGHGPCLAAAADQSTISIPDMRAETRWPDFTSQALQHGAGSSLSIGLPIEEGTRGALNIYGGPPNAFDDAQIDLANTFAGYAAVAVANAELYAGASTLAEQLQEAIASRAVIEQAKGVLMGQRRCSADEAFRILSRLSQDTNRKLRDVASAVVDQAREAPAGYSRSQEGGRRRRSLRSPAQGVQPGDTSDFSDIADTSDIGDGPM